jgi:hypothetical protein
MNTPNDEFEDRDPLLEGLFSREHTHLAAEPFSRKTLQAIAAERKRALRTRRLVQAAGVLALVVLAPQLIAASVWLSSALDEAFALASSWLATPYGIGAAALAALAALVTRLARVW